jgi:hypothetical protein
MYCKARDSYISREQNSSANTHKNNELIKEQGTLGAMLMLINNGYSTRLIRIYKTIMLPVVLYGCETWPLTLREEHRLRVFENRVLRRIFGQKRDEVTGEWRKLHNEELHNLYSSSSIIRIIKSRRMRWAGHVAQMREKRHAYRLLLGKPKGKDH